MACALVRSVSFGTPLLVLNRSDECHDQYEALLSLVPHATVGALGCDLGKTERLLRIAWLAHAVYHPKCRIQSLTISSNSTFANMNRGEVQYLTDIVRTGLPLRDVIGVALFSRDGARSRSIAIDCFSFGATVIVARGTPLYCEPARSKLQYLVLTAAHDEEVDVVAHLTGEGLVGIEYPGTSLLWTADTMVAWTQSGPV
jgi:hypothetical protein